MRVVSEPPCTSSAKPIAADAPMHAAWTRSCDRLLRQAETAFPADDYIGHVIVWIMSSRNLQNNFRRRQKELEEALCKTRALWNISSTAISFEIHRRFCRFTKS